MRILIVHNRYRQRGGEDVVAESEAALLRARGHQVETYFRDNEGIRKLGSTELVRQTLWSTRTTKDFQHVAADFHPNIVHVHNTFPLVSPSLFWAAAKCHVPVVQTLHNFRLLCPQAMFLRNNVPCEDCLGTVPWRGIMHQCYRDSAAQSAVLVGMLSLHRSLGTYRNKVTRYIALNRFCQSKFIAGGLPPERISIKPNFVASVPAASHRITRSNGLFVGRLSPEKGTDVLREAMLCVPGARMRVVGSGPAQASLSGHAGIELCGEKDYGAVINYMRQAAYLVMPSLWYENFPMVLLEAFATGLPVIASRLGAMWELVDDGRTGLLVDPGSAEDLSQKILWAEAHPEQMRQMGQNAREEYMAKYTPEENYMQLMHIYHMALDETPVLH